MHHLRGSVSLLLLIFITTASLYFYCSDSFFLIVRHGGQFEYWKAGLVVVGRGYCCLALELMLLVELNSKLFGTRSWYGYKCRYADKQRKVYAARILLMLPSLFTVHLMLACLLLLVSARFKRVSYYSYGVGGFIKVCPARCYLLARGAEAHVDSHADLSRDRASRSPLYLVYLISDHYEEPTAFKLQEIRSERRERTSKGKLLCCLRIIINVAASDCIVCQGVINTAHLILSSLLIQDSKIQEIRQEQGEVSVLKRQQSVEQSKLTEESNRPTCSNSYCIKSYYLPASEFLLPSSALRKWLILLGFGRTGKLNVLAWFFSTARHETSSGFFSFSHPSTLYLVFFISDHYKEPTEFKIQEIRQEKVDVSVLKRSSSIKNARKSNSRCRSNKQRKVYAARIVNGMPSSLVSAAKGLLILLVRYLLCRILLMPLYCVNAATLESLIVLLALKVTDCSIRVILPVQKAVTTILMGRGFIKACRIYQEVRVIITKAPQEYQDPRDPTEKVDYFFLKGAASIHKTANEKVRSDHYKEPTEFKIQEIRQEKVDVSVLKRSSSIKNARKSNSRYVMGKLIVHIFNHLHASLEGKCSQGKLKSRWSGPFTIAHVFPYGTIELSQPEGPNFKMNGHRVKHYFGEDVPKLVVLDLQTFPKDK
ncbi:hypothetical protein Tco_0127014 [Tanacetum coccineum]